MRAGADSGPGAGGRSRVARPFLDPDPARADPDPGGRWLRIWWGTTAVFTGVVAGFMVSYALVLGPYFDWLIDGGAAAAFAPADARSYARFRAERDPVTPYLAVCFAQFGAALAFLVAAVRARRRGIRVWRAALGPALAMPFLVALHTATGFAAAEQAVLSGAASAAPDGAAARATFRTWNGPLHAVDALLFAVPLVGLLRARPSR